MTYGRGGSVRAFSVIVLVAGLAFLVACGGSSTPTGVPIVITLSASNTSLNPGQSSTVTAVVANDSNNKGVSWSVSPSGFGTLSNQTPTSVTYTAPASVPTATLVTITATSVASSTVTASVQIAVQTSSISISLAPAAPQTVDQGQQLSVNATLKNDPSNKGVTWSLSPNIGSLSTPTSTAVTYVAPNSVTGNTAVTLKATSVASSSATASLEITIFPSGAGPNVAALNVTTGPVGNSANLAFVSLTICAPGTTTCQTVDNIQVDTGSAGLRILQSAIPSLILPTLTDTTGNTLDNCAQFADTSYLWGPVQQADIKIGGEVAGSALIQTVSTSTSGIPTACSSGSGPGDENTPTALGANGILGVGLEPTDCTFAGSNFCDGSVSSPPNVYFSCPSSGCAATDLPIEVPASDQVINPVVLFAADNNGVVLQLPSVLSTAATVSGSLIFGIATEPNNGLGSATLFGLGVNDNFDTLYTDPTFGLQNLTDSIIDSGSNAFYFPSSLTVCSDATFFYCPALLTPQTATNEGTNNVPSIVNFSVDNADNLFNNNPGDAAFGTLAGPFGSPNTCTSNGGSCTFDWGLPFFYGKTVFTAIDGQNVAGVGAGPFWAY
jgi:Protein of unknown function (DUF3443)